MVESQSPSSAQDFPMEEPEYRPLATALHSYLLHDDVGRRVIIVCSKRRSNTFHKRLDDEDFSDEPWF